MWGLRQEGERREGREDGRMRGRKKDDVLET